MQQSGSILLAGKIVTCRNPDKGLANNIIARDARARSVQKLCPFLSSPPVSGPVWSQFAWQSLSSPSSSAVDISTAAPHPEYCAEVSTDTGDVSGTT